MTARFDGFFKYLTFVLFFQSTCGFIQLIPKLLELGLTIQQMQDAKNKPAAQNPLKGFECLAVYAPIRCGTEDGGVVVQLVDEDNWPAHDLLDQSSFSSKHGAAVLSGCASDDGDGKIDPELVIIHTCKGAQAKRIRIPIPRDAVSKAESGKLKYHKINTTIDLKAKHNNEEDWPHCPTC